MEHEFAVILHSKYSRASQDFDDIVSSIPPIVRRCLVLRSLCIDSETIRRRLTASHFISIDVVPAILVFYENDAIEKYEAETAYNWIEESVSIVQELLKPDPTEINTLLAEVQRLNIERQRDHHMYETNVQHLKQQLMHQSTEAIRAIESPAEMPQQHLTNHQDVRKLQHADDPRNDAPRFSNLRTIDEIEDEQTRTTAIDDIDPMLEDTSEMGKNDDRPPVVGPDGKVTSVFSSQPDPRDSTPSSAKERKSASLMAAAANLQKGREDSNPPRPPGYPDAAKA